MKLRQAKKIFYKEYLSISYYKQVKASNRLIKAINVLKHFRYEEYWMIKIDKDRTITIRFGG